MDYGHWNIAAVGEFEPSDFFGFIYEIEELATGRSYIGKKFLRFKRGRKTIESDWREYTSSCVPLCEAIQEQGKNGFKFHILSLCVGRCQLTYEEQQLQFTRDVLRTRLPNGERKYWNKTIGHLLFAGVERQTEEAKRKISEKKTGKTLTPEHCQKISAAQKHQSPAQRLTHGRPQVVKNMVGQVFGAWTVLCRGNNTTSGLARWICRCSCGNESEVHGSDLRFGKSTRCETCRLSVRDDVGKFQLTSTR